MEEDKDRIGPDTQSSYFLLGAPGLRSEARPESVNFMFVQVRPEFTSLQLSDSLGVGSMLKLGPEDVGQGTPGRHFHKRINYREHFLKSLKRLKRQTQPSHEWLPKLTGPDLEVPPSSQFEATLRVIFCSVLLELSH